ncbi:MAG TPA: PorP/SprF family type IX secretion system membrane protein [Bacteroidia bacterium]|nr:PorP/SprF family type IX secretion system membrane protein [Bacteroidia bacterium]
MKKFNKVLFFILVLAFDCTSGYAQQLPVFTQFPSDLLYFNPAIAGTKRQYDVRIDYRDQWVGFPDAPVTEGLSLNYRLMGGKMGVAFDMYQDVTGPTQRNEYTGCYAYHLKLPDLIISFGVQASMVDYIVNGPKITIHQSGDPAIDQAATSSALTPNAGAGFYMYNDRWQFGLSADNLIQEDAKLYKKYTTAPGDTSTSGIVTLIPHFYGFLGYNFSGNANYVWQSSLFAEQSGSTPLYLAYSLRVHIKELFYVGFSLRLQDAAALDLGVTIKNDFELCYSYDFITSALGHYTTGSHEITLIWSSDHLGKGSAHRGDTFDTFQKKKYGYMF